MMKIVMMAIQTMKMDVRKIAAWSQDMFVCRLILLLEVSISATVTPNLCQLRGPPIGALLRSASLQVSCITQLRDQNLLMQRFSAHRF